MTEDDKTKLDYERTAQYFLHLADVRFRLLALLPIVSGAALALVPAHRELAETFALGILGLVVTIGLLLFFPDRVAAPREMRRVLARDGRVAVMSWEPPDRCPGHTAMAQVRSKHFGAEQAAKSQPMHSLHDPAEVCALLEAAGFAEVEVRTQMGRAHFPSPRALACSYGALTGLEADAATRDALCADLTRLLRDSCGGDGLNYPIEAVLARACRRTD